MPINILKADMRLIGHSGADTRLSVFELPIGDGHKVQASVCVPGVVANRAISIPGADS
jgi:hypothetical protein